jgi:hypothetical protein
MHGLKLFPIGAIHKVIHRHCLLLLPFVIGLQGLRLTIILCSIGLFSIRVYNMHISRGGPLILSSLVRRSSLLYSGSGCYGLGEGVLVELYRLIIGRIEGIVVVADYLRLIKMLMHIDPLRLLLVLSILLHLQLLLLLLSRILY